MIQDCQIHPLGSFALDCIPKISNPITMDILITFREKDTPLETIDILNLYKQSL